MRVVKDSIVILMFFLTLVVKLVCCLSNGICHIICANKFSNILKNLLKCEFETFRVMDLSILLVVQVSLMDVY